MKVKRLVFGQQIFTYKLNRVIPSESQNNAYITVLLTIDSHNTPVVQSLFG